MLCDTLAHLFNASLTSGIFPNIWKESLIIPLHKNGSKSNVNNYRGIAKLSAIPKAFEHIVTDSITPQVTPIISDTQHGFTKGRSTVTNLLEFTSFVTDGFAAGKQTDVVFTDFTKVFDRLHHPLLLIKLDNTGFSPLLLRWIESYLSNRTQRVLFNNQLSRQVIVSSGVPQGSHLGPLLFTIFINDLPQAIQNSKIFMFADDVKICGSYNPALEPSVLQSDLDRFTEWCHANLLTVNVSKCKQMSFSWREIRHRQYNLNGTDLDSVTEFRDLGVLVDNKLRFNLHIQNIVGKAKAALGFMKRWSREFNDAYVTKLLFMTIVRPILEYASPVWSPYYDVHSDAIESVQKQFLLFALNYLPWDPELLLPPYKDRLKLIHLPTLESRRTSANVVFLHKLLSGDINSPMLLGRVKINVPQRSQRRYVPIWLDVCVTNYADNEPFRSICKDYNKLYHRICTSHSVANLKSSIIVHLNS